MKICRKCGKNKDINDYYTHRGALDGHLNSCKDCVKIRVQKNYWNNRDKILRYNYIRQRYDKKRIFDHRYSGLVARSTRKCLGRSAFGKKFCTRDEYNAWVAENLTDFHCVYERWEESGFTRRLSPSIDRINNKLGYIPSNMRWVHLYQNSQKGTK